MSKQKNYSDIEIFESRLKDRYKKEKKHEHHAIVRLVNFDKRMKASLKSGNGFIITDKDGLDKSKTERTENGIYSPKFGSIWGDSNAFEELWSCDCGAKTSKQNRDIKCEKCNSYVTFKGKNVDKRGWFMLEKYQIIHPNIYLKLISLIGGTRLKEILDVRSWKVGIDGMSEKPIIDETSKNIKKYDNIGMIEFQKRYDEIIDFFYSKHRNKKDVYDFLKEEYNREATFTHCLPVIPLFLRPIIIGEEDFNYDKLNPKYANISTKVYNINNRDYSAADEKVLLNRLFSLQKQYQEVCDLLLAKLDKKTGQLRNEIIGFRLNFTVRAVITPMSYCKLNEVKYPYLGFLEMYKPEIISTIAEMKRCTINEAKIHWNRAYLKFDPFVYRIMCYIMTHQDCYIPLNRNPTLNYGSILRMKITHIKSDYNDLTISIPINVCPIKGADFDGDQENTQKLPDRFQKDAYEIFDPTRYMMISQNDGLFDNSFNLIKDQMICLHEFCRRGPKKKIRVLREPDGTEHDDVQRPRVLKITKEKKKKERILKLERKKEVI